MGKRLDLHSEFISLLGTDSEDSRVYFQPPTSLKMKYPCIRYSLSDVDQLRADDRNYRSINEYEVTIIDPDPDSDIHIRVMNHFKMCVFDRAYTADNLNHRVLTLYY